MPVRRVGKGSVEYRRLGAIKGWETTEVCTTSMSEVGNYLRGQPPYTRVWVSVKGNIHIPSGEIKLDDEGRPVLTPAQQSKYAKPKERNVHLTIIHNEEYRALGDPDVQMRALRDMAPYWDPVSEDYDIEFFCVRTKEPL